ncbi:hypothetical protein ANRL3_01868 [Anaerolineae bacterium]|nr:hypothetical protein ANRL3_01868 [Anaerolineae bacterium]
MPGMMIEAVVKSLLMEAHASELLEILANLFGESARRYAGTGAETRYNKYVSILRNAAKRLRSAEQASY